MHDELTIEELAQELNACCDRHQVRPVNEQAGERLTERNALYYRTLGLVDAPVCGGGAGYGERHLLQLVALRILQAHGLPLNRIHSLLFRRTTEELREIQTRVVSEMNASSTAPLQLAGSEAWKMTPIDDDFLLVSRSGWGISEVPRAHVRAALRPEDHVATRRGDRTSKERK